MAKTRVKLGTLSNFELFAHGWTQDGSYQPPWLIQRLVENFQRFSTGPNPYQPVELAVGHDQDQRLLTATGLGSAGRLTAIRFAMEPDRWNPDGERLVIRGDADRVPDAVGDWIKEGRLIRPSIEYARDFRDHTGQRHGPAIVRVVLAGATPVRVKGLSDLPLAIFSDHSPNVNVLTFTDLFYSGGDTRMSREQLIEALAKAGYNTGLITDVVPDAVLEEMLRICQSMQAPNPVPAPAPVPNPDQVMTGNGNGVSEEERLKMQQMTAQFTQLTSTVTTLTGVVSSLANEVKLIRADNTSLKGQNERQQIQTFCEQLSSQGKLTPVELRGAGDNSGTIVDVLMAADNVNACFTDKDGKKVTARQLQMQMLEGRPQIARFTEQFTEPPSGGSVTPDRRQQLLSKTPLGRAALNGKASKN